MIARAVLIRLRAWRHWQRSRILFVAITDPGSTIVEVLREVPSDPLGHNPGQAGVKRRNRSRTHTRTTLR
jgi:hypothetical protein